ncbi:MAG: glycosyltransferase [Cyclobacteriaceae bacterium]
MPEVSVILPNYNHAKYLPERINSILRQTFRDFELIILDDCSMDNSREIIETFRGEPRITHLIYNEENSGTTFKQWNKGIALASSGYIWVAESDDRCEPDFLEKAVEKMKAHPSAGIVYAQSTEVDEVNGGKFLSFSQHPRFSNQFNASYFNVGVNEIRDKLIYENTIPNASGVLFKKEIYYACGGADESMRLCGDWMLWSKMLSISDVYFIAEPLNYFRLTNISARNRYAWLNTVNERMKVLNYITEHAGAFPLAKTIQVASLKRIFKSFPLSKTAGAFRFAYDQSGDLKNKSNKIWKAFFLSLKDRLKRSFDNAGKELPLSS